MVQVLVLVLEGRIFPSVSIRYFVEFYIITGEAFSYRLVISDLKFERSGRLRVLQKPIQSITGTAPWGNQIKSDLGWYVDLIFSMDRLGAMLPVSDGISQSKNPDPDDGLAFLQGEVIDAWPSVCPSGNPPSKPDDDYRSVLVCPDDEMLESNLQEAKDLNSSGTRIDITVIWRHRDPIRIPPRIGEPCLGDVGNVAVDMDISILLHKADMPVLSVVVGTECKILPP